ncbi:hypothetical protein ACJX0J_028669, partial [Zea mays]
WSFLWSPNLQQVLSMLAGLKPLNPPQSIWIGFQILIGFKKTKSLYIFFELYYLIWIRDLDKIMILYFAHKCGHNCEGCLLAIAILHTSRIAGRVIAGLMQDLRFDRQELVTSWASFIDEIEGLEHVCFFASLLFGGDIDVMLPSCRC